MAFVCLGAQHLTCPLAQALVHSTRLGAVMHLPLPGASGTVAAKVPAVVVVALLILENSRVRLMTSRKRVARFVWSSLGKCFRRQTYHGVGGLLANLPHHGAAHVLKCRTLELGFRLQRQCALPSGVGCPTGVRTVLGVLV